MTERWSASQEAVEAALARGPQTVDELVEVTGYSATVIRRAVQREGIFKLMTFWPRKYALEAGPLEEFPRVVQYVKPLEIPREEIGARWQEGKASFGKDIAQIDLNRLTLDLAREKFRAATATLLGILVTLDQMEDGPEWRSEVGL